MSNKITNVQLAERITQYYSVQRNILKSLTSSDAMTFSIYQTLNMLSERGQMRMGEIADILAISRPNLTPLVDKLFAINYIDRVGYNHDRRVTYIMITDTGRAALEKEKSVIVAGISRFTSKLSDEENEKFINALDTITEMFSRV